MSNVFRTLREGTSRFIILAWPIALLMFTGSIFLMIEDFRTSYHGYSLVPTPKMDSVYVPIFVALLPQGVQILALYIFGRDTNRRGVLLLWLIMFLLDLGTDVAFKMNNTWSAYMFFWAIVESLAIFTIGSEGLFSFTGGFLWDTWRDFVSEVWDFINTIIDGIASLNQSADKR